MALGEAFQTHLAGGVTTVARAWAVVREDGKTLGFTDHDLPLTFEGIMFEAASGLTAQAVQQSTGLAVDNSEALGALSHPAITEGDLDAGRYDGAEVQVWLVNWADVAQRAVIFRGSIGEVERADGAFRAELRGLTEALNQPQGRVYQGPCAAVLGDAACKVDLGAAAYSVEAEVISVGEGRTFDLGPLEGYAEGWFERGVLRVLSGQGAGLSGLIRSDRKIDGARQLQLWERIRAGIGPGDRVRVSAGCDKRAVTCRAKFSNFNNFRGFPHIPGEDWLMAYPTRDGANDGGSLR